MNAERDIWDDFAAALDKDDREELLKPLTPLVPSVEIEEAMREQYEREQIESARSEAAYQANVKAYSHVAH